MLYFDRHVTLTLVEGQQKFGFDLSTPLPKDRYKIGQYAPPTYSVPPVPVCLPDNHPPLASKIDPLGVRRDFSPSTPPPECLAIHPVL